MTDAPERIYAWVYRDGDRMHHNWRGAVTPCEPWQTEYIRADLATPMRCAECDCEKGGADCNWIATPAPAMCCLGLTPEQCAHTPSSQCEGLRPAVDPMSDPLVVALVEALKEAERMLKHYGSRDAGGMAQIRAALIALEENK